MYQQYSHSNNNKNGGPAMVMMSGGNGTNNSGVAPPPFQNNSNNNTAYVAYNGNANQQQHFGNYHHHSQQQQVVMMPFNGSNNATNGQQPMMVMMGGHQHGQQQGGAPFYNNNGTYSNNNNNNSNGMPMHYGGPHHPSFQHHHGAAAANGPSTIITGAGANAAAIAAANGHGASVKTSQSSYRNLYVSGLSVSVTDDDLKSLFARFGRIESAKVMIDVSTGLSRGFAFVLFSKVEEGQAAFSQLHGKDITIRGDTFKMKLMPSEHDGRQAATPTPIIYVRNLPGGASEQMVRSHFNAFGEVISFSMRPIGGGGGSANNNNNASSSGAASSDPSAAMFLATVEYRSVDGASAAIDGTHNKKIFDVCVNPVLAKFADTQEMKEAKKAKRGVVAAAAAAAANTTNNNNASVSAMMMSGGVASPTNAAPVGSAPNVGFYPSQQQVMLMGSTAGTANAAGGGNTFMDASALLAPIIDGSNGAAPTGAGAAPMPAVLGTVGVNGQQLPILNGIPAGAIPIPMASIGAASNTISPTNAASGGASNAFVASSTKGSATDSPKSLTSQQAPPAAHLPLPPRHGEQAVVYFQGLLIKTPEGYLIPAHTEQCRYVEGLSSTTHHSMSHYGSGHNAGAAPFQPFSGNVSIASTNNAAPLQLMGLSQSAAAGPANASTTTPFLNIGGGSSQHRGTTTAITGSSVVALTPRSSSHPSSAAGAGGSSSASSSSSDCSPFGAIGSSGPKAKKKSSSLSAGGAEKGVAAAAAAPSFFF